MVMQLRQKFFKFHFSSTWFCPVLANVLLMSSLSHLVLCFDFSSFSSTRLSNLLVYFSSCRNTLKHINITGHSLLPGDCRNAWLFAWLEGGREKREVWREEVEEEEQPRDWKRNEAARTRETTQWEQETGDNRTAESSRGSGNECPSPGSNSSCCECLLAFCIVECCACGRVGQGTSGFSLAPTPLSLYLLVSIKRCSVLSVQDGGRRGINVLHLPPTCSRSV